MKNLILALDGIRNPQLIANKIFEVMGTPSEMPDYVSHFKFNDAFHLEGFKELLPLVVGNYPEISIFWDLKLPDTNGTDSNILSNYLKYMRPGDIITVTSDTSLRAFREIRKVVPVGVKIAIVSVKTDTGRDECKTRRGMSPEMAILNDARNLLEMEPTAFDAVICSPKELRFLKTNLPGNIEFFVPGVRDSWMEAGQQSKDRISGIRNVLADGATAGILGAQLMKGNPETGITAEESRRLTLIEIGLTWQVKRSKENINYQDDLLGILKQVEGYYESPKDENGKYLGPLVAYAGTYETPDGPKNKVGFKYFNFAKAESRREPRFMFANTISESIINYINDSETPCPACDVALGAPMGGIFLAETISEIIGCRVAFAEKKVTALADKENGTKEKSELVIDRHDVYVGENVIIVEDVCNNFSTTEKLKVQIEKRGGKLVGIACAINRSGETDWEGIPVFSALFIPTEQYTQEDPAVAGLIAEGMIVWKPKQTWRDLKAAMAMAEIVKEK